MSRTHDVTISAFDLDRIESELAAVTDQRDRLAEAIEQSMKHMRHSLNCCARLHHTHPCSCGMEKAEDEAKQALQSLTNPNEL
jgi:gamma-glutamyl:cysteine ligase YbdK (ATP-grasp superfamily)